MQIKSLLVFLPLLLEPASSLVVPAVQDPCEALARRGDSLQDVPKDLLSRCGRDGQMREHSSPMTDPYKFGRYPPNFPKPRIGVPQNRTLSIRAPAKKDSKKTKKPGDPSSGTPAEKPKDSSSGTPGQVTEWHKVTPKKEDQLPEGQKSWGDEDLRQNL